MTEEIEKKIGNEVRDFLRDSSKAKKFTLKEICNDERFKRIEEVDRGFFIREYLNLFESIGMIDKIGKTYYVN